MRGRNHGLWTLAIALVVLATSAQAAPTTLGGPLEGTEATITVLEDPGRSLDLDAVRDADAAGRFTAPVRRAVPASRSAWWVRVQVENPTTEPARWWIQSIYPLTDYFDVHQVTEAGPAEPIRLGDRRPFDERPVLTEEFVVPLITAPGEVDTVYVRLAYADAGVVETSLRLWSEPELSAFLARNGALHGLYFGALGALFLYNLFIFAATRRRAYGWYLVYLFGIGVTSAALLGFGHRFLWGESAWMTEWMPVLAPALHVAAAAQFTRSFLETRRWARRIDLGLVGLVAAGFLAAALCLMGQKRAATLLVLTLTACLAFFPAIGANLWRRGHPDARIYTLAWMAIAVGALIVVGRFVGLLPSRSWWMWSHRIGVVVEATILSFALLGWARRARADVEDATAARLLAEREASIDPLTGLLNRRAFAREAAVEFARSSRYGSAVALLMVDVDHFKRVNDTHGHPVGDAVLRCLAASLKAELRDCDRLARYGGEEFVALLPETDLRGAVEGAERLRHALENLPAIAGLVRFTVSVGVAERRAGESLEQALARADSALYEAKASGRNAVRANVDSGLEVEDPGGSLVDRRYSPPVS